MLAYWQAPERSQSSSPGLLKETVRVVVTSDDIKPTMQPQTKILIV